jgi:hypothetical protein
MCYGRSPMRPRWARGNRRRQHMLGACLLVAGLIGSAAANAGPRAVHLVYNRGAGAEQCPSQAELQQGIIARLGRDPFWGHGARQVWITISRSGTELVATIAAQPEDGGAAQVRAVTSRRAACAELASAVELALAIAIDPVAAAGRSVGNSGGRRRALRAALRSDGPGGAPVGNAGSTGSRGAGGGTAHGNTGGAERARPPLVRGRGAAPVEGGRTGHERRAHRRSRRATTRLVLDARGARRRPDRGGRACQVQSPGSTSCFPNAIEYRTNPGDDGGAPCVFASQDENGGTSEWFVVPCCKEQRCLASECQCDQSGCSYNAGFLSSFDLSINGTHADGSAIHLIQTQ